MLDQLRELRLLIPPFFLFSSLLWGAFLAQSPLLAHLTKLKDAQTLTVAAAGAATIPLGFVISVVGLTALRTLFWIFPKRWLVVKWDVPYSEASVERMCRVLKLERDMSRDLQTIARFDRTVMPKEVLEWILRRWTSFLVSVHSIVALVLAHVIALLVGIQQTTWWGCTTLLICILLVPHAVTAWREAGKMGDVESLIAERKANQSPME